jgi:methylphosphotriester-DNA--protein-cysteine methyltransferase
MMIKHPDIDSSVLHHQIRRKEILFAGNQQLKIYGTLKCKSGKRIKQENRVFFSSKEDAVINGFRPCGHCMREKYKEWKKDN